MVFVKQKLCLKCGAHFNIYIKDFFMNEEDRFKAIGENALAGYEMYCETCKAKYTKEELTPDLSTKILQAHPALNTLYTNVDAARRRCI